MTDSNEGPPDFFSQPDAGTSAEGSANPFAASSAVTGGSAGGASPGGPEGASPGGPEGASPSMANANAGGSVAEPIDPELFAGPPVADSYAPAGTGVSGEAPPMEDGQQDARIPWRAENAKALEKKEEEEKKANEEVRATAKDWLQRFNDDRDKRIEKTKKDNAAQEKDATKGPTGDTDWAKVNSMIDFTFKPPQEREAERERFKKLLFDAKTKNVPVSA